MCLLVCAWRIVPGVPLLVLANRDEFHARPTAALAAWGDGLLAGRDLRGGGTWLGVHGRRFAALTNVREPSVPPPPGAPSRGELVPDFLRSPDSPLAWLGGLSGDRYPGYNLLVSDGETLAWGSNRTPEPLPLGPGIYGISNAGLDTPWPKLARLRSALEEALGNPTPDPGQLLALLRDETRPPEDELPETGVGLDLERLLSPIYIRGEAYGTRSSTLVLGGPERVEVWEQGYGPEGRVGERIQASLTPTASTPFEPALQPQSRSDS